MDFYVAVVDKNPSDSWAARSPGEALEIANPDPGSRVDIYIVDASDAGEARLIYKHPVRGGTLIRTLKKK